MVGPGKNIKFSRTLIDGGSSINIMYRDSMHKLGITEGMLKPSRTTFHGIVLEISCAPMGQIRIDVIFGTRDNCRVENINFEVVDFASPYHLLNGRPAMHKFMATAHMSYLKMKMPGPNGVISISGNYKRSMECASASSVLAESMVIAEAKRRIEEVRVLVQQGDVGLPAMSNPNAGVAFRPVDGTKSVSVDPDFPERTVGIGAGLTEK